MEIEEKDVNTDESSSTSSDVKGVDSSSTDEVVKQEVAVEETQADDNSSTESTTEETTEEQTPEEQSEEKEVTTEEKKTEEAIPYERFNEVNNKKVELESRIEQDKPLVEQARATNDFLRQHNITPQEYQSALQYLMFLRHEPTKAYEMMKPTYEQLALLAGERLPADLQAKVAAGTLDNADATELARNRAQQQYNQWKNQTQQGAQQNDVGQLVGMTIQSWAGTKQSVDPDFKQGSDLWELTDKNIKAMPPFRNAQEAMAGSEKAYQDAKAFMKKYQPKAAVVNKKTPPAKTSMSNNSPVIKSAADVVKALKAGLKPAQMQY